jgi:Peptidase family S64
MVLLQNIRRQVIIITLLSDSLFSSLTVCFLILRFGGNRVNTSTFENQLVEGVRLLEPGMEVYKVGRTTLDSRGAVQGCAILEWADGKCTVEIAVLGENTEAFGDLGDSGSLVFTESGITGSLYGVGILIGRNQAGNFGLVSPLWAVIEDAQAKLRQEINFKSDD